MWRYILAYVLAIMIPATVHAQSVSSAEALESVGPGTVNWTAGEVYATGIGAPPSNAVNPAQARAMAERAAMVVALRNLLEVIKGVRIDSETVVENFMTTSDIIRTQVSGIVRGAMPVKKQYLSDGSVEITVGMKMRGAFLDVIIPENFGVSRAIVPLPPTRPVPPSPVPAKPVPPTPPPVPERKPEPVKPEPAKPEPQQPARTPTPPPPPAPSPAPPSPGGGAEPSTAQFKGGKATGVVIDGRGLGLRPALLPRIIDQSGQEIYVGQVVTRTNAVEQGVAGYAKDVNAAANNFRVTDNPAVIKGQRASGAGKTDIILTNADAQVLRDLSRKGDFLQYCRVIIVY